MPAAARAPDVRVERDHGLEHEVRVHPAVREPEPAFADAREEEVLDRRLADDVACRIAADRVGREEIREVVPEPGLRIVAVRVLEPLDRADRLDLRDARLDAVEPLAQRNVARRALLRTGTARGEQRGSGD